MHKHKKHKQVIGDAAGSGTNFTVQLNVSGKFVPALIDTGSPVSFLRPAVDSSVLKNVVRYIQSFGNIACGSFHVSE